MSFDPLDFLSASEVKQRDEYQFDLNGSASTHLDKQQDDENRDEEAKIEEYNELYTAPLQIVDLPSLKYAPKEVIYVILKLLAPSQNLNFQSLNTLEHENSELDSRQICAEKDIEYTCFEGVYKWFSENWSMDVFCLQSSELFLQQLLTISNIDSKDQLSYYTNILSYYNNRSSGKEEKSGESITGDMILKQCSLRISERCGRTAQPASNKVFQLDGLSDQILMHEPGMVGDCLGLKTWGAALPLSQRLMNLEFPKDFVLSKKKKKKSRLNVLELGAGTGLVGISFALKVMSHIQNECDTQEIKIWLTDLPEIVPNLQKNVELNKLSATVQTNVLDWTDHSSFIEENPELVENTDIILIADPIYSPHHPQWVTDTILKFLTKTHKEGIVFLEIPKRDKYENERQTLWDLFEKHGLIYLDEGVEEGFDDFGRTQYIYKKLTYRV